MNQSRDTTAPAVIFHSMLPSQNYGFNGVIKMSEITIAVRYAQQDTMPELLKLKADELDITVEQLVKRFICASMQAFDMDSDSSIPGESLNDFLAKNGVRKVL